MIKLTRLFLSLLLLGLGAAVASAMNNDDVIKMVKAELDDDTIILAIDAAKKSDFDVTADGLVTLKNAGVDQDVIQAILKKQGARAPSTASDPDDDEPEKVTSITSKEADDDDVLPPQIEPVTGQEYFTRYTLKYEDKEWPTTNYARGQTLPINTQVTLLSIGKNSFMLKLVESGATLKIENVEKHSKRPTLQVARELLAEEPTAIEKYGEDMAAAIRTGTLRLGMTKTQVLLTRGYPPGHETSSLELPLWKYWSSRFVVHSLAFEDDILVKARGVD